MPSATLTWPHYATCLWPGLAELWWRGRLSGLPAAIIFAIAVNGMLIAVFLFPAWVSGGLIKIACFLGLIVWGFWAVRSFKALPEMLVPRQISDQPDRFPEAQIAYLAGDWKTAERFLTHVLAIEPRDPPALLLLCGVYRHTTRPEAAEALLGEIERLEVADRWWLEIAAEKKRLERTFSQTMSGTEKAPIPAV